MAPPTEALIKPELLVRARYIGGLDVAQITRKLNIPIDRSQACESRSKETDS